METFIKKQEQDGKLVGLPCLSLSLKLALLPGHRKRKLHAFSTSQETRLAPGCGRGTPWIPANINASLDGCWKYVVKVPTVVNSLEKAA